MLISKQNVVVHTVQIDLEDIEKHISDFDIFEDFAREFEREGMQKEVKRMRNGGFSYKMTSRTSYYEEYEISIITRTKYL